MPSRIESATDTAFAFPKAMWEIVKSYWWIVFIIVLVIVAIVLWSKYRNSQLKQAFVRRKLEVIEGTKINSEIAIKDVFISKDGANLKFVGKYVGHFNSEIEGIKKEIKEIYYVLASRGFLMDLWKGTILIACPKPALKHIYVGKKHSITLIGESLEYNIKTSMYTLEGDWKGFNVAISKNWIDRNILEMFQDYSAKLLVVQDQAIQQLDLELKKKMKGIEDVVEDEQ